MLGYEMIMSQFETCDNGLITNFSKPIMSFQQSELEDALIGEGNMSILFLEKCHISI